MAKVIALLFVVSSFQYGISTQECSNYNPCPLETGELLLHPRQLFSKNGQLQATIKVQMSKVKVGGWLELWRRTYNGRIGGPTLRVRPGDTINVNLMNTLGSNTRENSHSQLKFANTTNLYLHGLHVSPKSNDATMRVEPGQKMKYSYTIDCNHPPGTYWYHPHVHGSSMFQTLSGMAGMFVVEDIPSKHETSPTISDYSCPKHCDHEVHLLFQPTMLYKIELDGFSFARVQKRIRDNDNFRNRERLPNRSTLGDWLISRVNNVHYFTTNGQIQPKIRLQAGKTMRFRMVNAGGLHVLEIKVPSSSDGHLCEVYEIARDGIYLSQPLKARDGTSIIPQGGTLDWLIRCDSAGHYKIDSVPNSRENKGLGRTNRFRGLLATMEVIEAPKIFKKSLFLAKFDEDVPLVLPTPPKFMPNLQNVAHRHITGKYVVEACANNILNRQKYKGINDPVRHFMPLDGIQEWTLLNADPTNAHTIHVQGNVFQVISYNAYHGPVSVTTSEGTFLLDHNGKFCNDSAATDRSKRLPTALSLKKAGIRKSKYTTYDGQGYAPPGEWRNTIILPPLSNLTVRLFPRHFTGKSMVHSQNLLRDDFGMKMLVQTVEKGQILEDDTMLKMHGLPGTCGPDDFYPTATQQAVSFGKETFEGFFEWLYNLRPIYRSKFGDQRYLSGIYEVYLTQLGKSFNSGDHLKDFFEWAYDKFPGYREFYGDQRYLAELYDYYVARHVQTKSTGKE